MKINSAIYTLPRGAEARIRLEIELSPSYLSIKKGALE